MHPLTASPYTYGRLNRGAMGWAGRGARVGKREVSIYFWPENFKDRDQLA